MCAIFVKMIASTRKKRYTIKVHAAFWRYLCAGYKKEEQY